MDIADILKQYADRPTDTHADFDEVARQVPSDVLGSGIAQAFRSDQTPDFGSMVGSLFGGSNPQQRAGLLGQLVRSVAPAVLSGLAGGALGRIFQGARSGAVPSVAPPDVVDITPDQVRGSPPRRRTTERGSHRRLLRRASRSGEGAGRHGAGDRPRAGGDSVADRHGQAWPPPEPNRCAPSGLHGAARAPDL
jgi:hypothetical protein